MNRAAAHRRTGIRYPLSDIGPRRLLSIISTRFVSTLRVDVKTYRVSRSGRKSAIPTRTRWFCFQYIAALGRLFARRDWIVAAKYYVRTFIASRVPQNSAGKWFAFAFSSERYRKIGRIIRKRREFAENRANVSSPRSPLRTYAINPAFGKTKDGRKKQSRS